MNSERMKRVLFMAIGVFFMGVSVAMLVRSDMGTDPFTTACLAFAGKTGWLLGSAELLVNAVMFAVVLWQERKQIGLGTLANMVCVGYIADFVAWCMRLWAVPVPQTLIEKTFWMIPALLIFVVAASLYMTAQMGTAPYDAMSFVLAKKLPQFPFRVVRMVWDLIWIVLTLLLGGNVGPVTIAIMLTMGPTVDAVGKWTKKHLYGNAACGS